MRGGNIVLISSLLGAVPGGQSLGEKHVVPSCPLTLRVEPIILDVSDSYHTSTFAEASHYSISSKPRKKFLYQQEWESAECWYSLALSVIYILSHGWSIYTSALIPHQHFIEHRARECLCYLRLPQIFPSRRLLRYYRIIMERPFFVR